MNQIYFFDLKFFSLVTLCSSRIILISSILFPGHSSQNLFTSLGRNFLIRLKDSIKSEVSTNFRSLLTSEVLPLERVCWIYISRQVFFERSSSAPSFKNQNNLFSTMVLIFKEINLDIKSRHSCFLFLTVSWKYGFYNSSLYHITNYCFYILLIFQFSVRPCFFP